MDLEPPREGEVLIRRRRWASEETGFAVEKRPGVEVHRGGKRLKLCAPHRQRDRLHKGHRIGLNLGRVEQNSVTMRQDDIG